MSISFVGITKYYHQPLTLPVTNITKPQRIRVAINSPFVISFVRGVFMTLSQLHRDHRSSYCTNDQQQVILDTYYALGLCASTEIQSFLNPQMQMELVELKIVARKTFALASIQSCRNLEVQMMRISIKTPR